MADIQGFCRDEFLAVREVLEKNLDSGADVGASAAVFLEGEPVVDLWGGYLDEARTQPWQSDTIIQTYSTTKTMTALCALILLDRGEIELDAPVARYWPEFAAEGKERITVRQVLAFTSGMGGWTEKMTLADLCDLEKSTALLARQAPWWEPGTAIGYHAFSIGHLVSEITRRVTGKTLGQFFAEEVAGPLGADYHIGTGPECDHRVAPLLPATPVRQPSGGDTLMDRAYFNPAVPPAASFTTMWRRAEVGGGNGHGNARSVAAVQSVLANGGSSGGVRLLSERGCERALEKQFEGHDVILGVPVVWGLGYCIGGPAVDDRLGPYARRRWAAWGGNGGSWVHVDFDARMSVAFVMNRWLEGYDLGRCFDVVLAAYESLGVAA